MDLLQTFIVQVLATFTGNFCLLYLIGIQAKRAEERRSEEILNYRREIEREMKEASERFKNYVNMES